MEQIFTGIPQVHVFLDDIVISGKTVEENLKITTEVFNKLRECGLKRGKCFLLEKKIRYMGVKIDKEGVHTLKERIEAINKTPEPTDLKGLQAFLGMINFYERFIENRAEKLHVLYSCLEKDKFEWTEECKRASQLAKDELKSARVLINYDLDKPIVLTK